MYRNGKFYCTNVCGVLLSETNCNLCMAYLINKITKYHVSYVGNPKLMNNVMGNITLLVPSSNEQEKISNVILHTKINIDENIKEIDCLKVIKNKYLQLLFN